MSTSEIAHLTEVIKVPVTTKSGEQEMLTTRRIDDEKFHLTDSIVHPFTHRNGDVILYIFKNGLGQDQIGKGKHKQAGMSLPALVGRHYQFGYVNDDMFDITPDNLISRRQKNTFK